MCLENLGIDLGGIMFFVSCVVMLFKLVLNVLL